MNKRYPIELSTTRKSKSKWFEFMKWWMDARQVFDPLPTKLRAFKKAYNTRGLTGAKELFKWKQRNFQNPIIVRN